MAHAGDRTPAATPVDHDSARPRAPRLARPRAVRRALARGALLATCAATALTGSVALAGPADAGNPVTPGNFTGLGFDQCLAPTSSAMFDWWRSSPYTAVGIYISGDSRGCRSQPNLSASWVTTQQKLGWKLLPITLGPQAACTTRDRYRHQVRINASSSGDYAAARRQGSAEATKAVSAAKKLAIAPGSTLWYDLEAFPTSSTSCKDSAMAFLSGWTKQLHALKYAAGAYSSAASGIKVMAAATKNKRFTMPERVWIADWNGVASTHTSYISDSYWPSHQRVHQYRGGHDERYGGVTINIDNNYLDLGKGSVAPATVARCNNTRINFTSYTTLASGAKDAAMVKALQCLLQVQGDHKGAVSGKYDAATIKAVRAFQARLRLPVSNTWSRADWVSLMAAGVRPVIKLGSSRDEVRWLQRALLATGHYKVPVNGVAGSSTMSALVAYRKRVGLPAVMVADTATWAAMRRGAGS